MFLTKKRSSMPTISVIIPIYNVENYLRRCLNSVLAQTFTDWEAICVNDGSPDNSAAILVEYAQKDDRIKIVNKENGGLSDARNEGMKHCQGDYIMYLDSDDLIHPQTMEIAYALAVRDGSDVVSWYKDKMFRSELIIRYRLGMDIDNALPRGIKKHYQIDKIKSVVTDDIFAHVTEESRSNIKNPITHFYVWRHLLKKELVEDVKFLKGVTYEDFPWWSEVILKNPRATITRLPFYYYFPNFKSINLGSKRTNKVMNWMRGLEHSYDLYQVKANDYQKSQWYKNCMWPVIIVHIARKLRKIKDPADIELIRGRLKTLWDKGIFDSPISSKDKYYSTVIKNFLEEE